jgi:hypothetical protein
MQVDAKVEIRVTLTGEEWSLVGRALAGKIRKAETAKAATLNVQLQERLLQRHQEMLQIIKEAAEKARQVLDECNKEVGDGEGA